MSIVTTSERCPGCPYRKPETIVLASTDQIVQGPLVLDLARHRVWWRGERVADMTAAELRVILVMSSKPGIWLTYRDIYDIIQRPGFHAGEGTRGYCNNVRSMIKRIRNKFRGVDPAFDAMQNRQGIGYCWGAP